MYRPLIFTACYGPDICFEILTLMLESLDFIGDYSGPVVILTDRNAFDVMKYVHLSLRERVQIVTLPNMDFRARYMIGNYISGFDGPIVNIDTDIIISKPVEHLFRMMESGEDIYISDEAETFPELRNGPVCSVQDPREMANWFGLDLIRADPELAQRYLPLANGGLYGFKNKVILEKTSKIVLDLYGDPSHASYIKTFGDQAFFNYAVARHNLVNAQTLSNETSYFKEILAPVATSRTFNHFAWARGEQKFRSMLIMLRDLKTNKTNGKDRAVP